MNRSEIPLKDKWNVEALYPDPSAWSQEFSSLKGVKELASYKGRLGDPKTLAEFMEKYEALDRKVSKLHVYAHLRLDEDLGNDTFKANYGQIMALAQDFHVQTSWLDPEILSLDESVLNHPSLKHYRFYFDQILRAKPHVLSADKEELMALTSKALQTSQKAFSSFSNADFEFKPAKDSQGNEYAVTNGSYGTLIQSSDRELRKSAMTNLFQGYCSHINGIAELLQGHIQTHVFRAKARGYKDAVSAALFSDNVDPSVVHQLIASVKKYSPAMEEYLALRQRTLQLNDIHHYDLMCKLTPDAEMKISYDEARQIVVESVAPLGQEYQASLRKGLYEDRWVDPFENKGKRSGAYSSGCYDSMPYILLNYHGTVNDVMTLAHEAGHSMHSYLSRQHQPPLYSQYTIFVAEVASTFNEQLLFDALMKRAKTKQEKAYLISDQLDRIRATIVRQTMFAEFELKIHELVEANQTLTPTVMNNLWKQLLGDYYGPNFVIDKEVESEWARIPHFYSNFYVYKYATGLSAALALHAQATKSPAARDKYLNFLRSGGSKYPLDLLKDAGVDMTTSAPIEAAMQKFQRLVGELRELLGK